MDEKPLYTVGMIRQMQRDEWLRPDQLAQARERDVGYLAKERTAGRGPAYFKDGKQIRYLVGDVVDWLDDHNVATADQPRSGTLSCADARTAS